MSGSANSAERAVRLPRRARSSGSSSGAVVHIGGNPSSEEALVREADRLGLTIDSFALPEVWRDLPGFVSNLRSRAGRQEIAGVTGTNDFASLVAGEVARQVGLPGPKPDALFMAQHKALSRKRQSEIAPQNVPAFWSIPLESTFVPEGFSFPVFVKPVKMSFSRGAREVRTSAELASAIQYACTLRRFFDPFEEFRLNYTSATESVHAVIAEELIHGQQVTVEGFVQHGQAQARGVVDSVMYPGTRSFSRFDYPSRLPADVQRAMCELACQLAVGLGLDDTLFNVEMAFDPSTNTIMVFEINPRISAQFDPLFRAVDGTGNRETQLMVAIGEATSPELQAGPHAVASCFVLRSREDQHVKRMPSQPDIDAIQRSVPQTLIDLAVSQGDRLSDHPNDTETFVWGNVTTAGSDEGHLQANLAAVLSRLNVGLEPVEKKESRG